MAWKTGEEVEEYLKDQEWFRRQDQRIKEKLVKEIKLLCDENIFLIETLNDFLYNSNLSTLKILLMQDKMIKNDEKIKENKKILKEKYNYIL